MFKRITLILLSAILSVGSFSSCGETVNEGSRATYSTSAKGRSGTLIDEFTEVAIHFNASGAFNGITLNTPSFSDDRGILTLTLYKWDANYERTLKGDPISKKTYRDFADNALQLFSTGTVQAGEYLLLASDGYYGVGVWTYNQSYSNVECYLNGYPSDMSMETEIQFCDADNAKLLPITKEVRVDNWSGGVPAESDDIENVVDISEYTMTDGLGRGYDMFETPDAKREDKTVGVFYWPWHYSFTYYGAYSINDLIEQFPEVTNDYKNSVWDPFINAKGFWNEPLFGCYSTLDRWVVRRHAEMLADADVDTLIFDCSNGSFTWRKGYELIADVFLEAQKDGVDVPQFVFMVNLNYNTSEDMVKQMKSIYENFYSDEKYESLWFRWKGKPLMLGNGAALSDSDPLEKAIAEFFNFRKTDFIYFSGEKGDEGSWGWLSIYPQTVYPNADGTAEEITVGVAQNASEYGLVAMNDYRGGVHGRSYTCDPDYSYSYTMNGETVTVDQNTPNASFYGLNFQEQWDRAIEVDPEFVFVTGWNEWVADRFEEWQGSENAFPDTFNNEYSRDIEPTKGALADYYYTQFCINIRRYKGAKTPAAVTQYDEITLDSDVSAWENVKTYFDYTGGNEARNADGYYGRHYDAEPYRNDIAKAKVACDAENVYFYVETADKLALPDMYDETWMRLYIDAGDSAESKNGFEYSVFTSDAATNDGDMKFIKFTDGIWMDVCDVESRIGDKYIVIKVPRSAIGMEDAVSLSFKWVDGAKENDPLTVYTDGDSAPNARFAYKYENTADN